MKRIIFSMLILVSVLSCSKKEGVKLDALKADEEIPMAVFGGCTNTSCQVLGYQERMCGLPIASWATDCKCSGHTSTPPPPPPHD